MVMPVGRYDVFIKMYRKEHIDEYHKWRDEQIELIKKDGKSRTHRFTNYVGSVEFKIRYYQWYIKIFSDYYDNTYLDDEGNRDVKQLIEIAREKIRWLKNGRA